jgi:hypothetical protein
MTHTADAIQQSLPPANHAMQLGAMRIALAIESLTAQGFTVIRIEFFAGSRPTIQVQAGPLCDSLIERGEATYYHTSAGARGYYRIGQFKFEDMRVLWSEGAH